MLREYEGSTDARHAKMGARGVEPAHGLTFPTSSKGDSEVKEEPQAGLEEAVLAHVAQTQQLAVQAAAWHACSTQEPAH